jgi:hypothetical protein
VYGMPHLRWILEVPRAQEGARGARPEGSARRGTWPRGAEPEERGESGPLSWCTHWIRRLVGCRSGLLLLPGASWGGAEGGGQPKHVATERAPPPRRRRWMQASPLDAHESPFCTGAMHQPRPSLSSNSPASSLLYSISYHPHCAQALRDHHGRDVVVEVEGPSDGSRRGRGRLMVHRMQGGAAAGGGLPQLLGRQVEKVRQCRIFLVSLPSAQPHPRLTR